MFPTGSNGDYDVTVKEADGSEQHFIVPYSSLPILQRTGRAKYSVTVGKYRDYNNHTLDDFGQAALLYGLPWGITLYGGSAELPIEDYTDGKSSTEFTAAPVNTIGHVPHTGEYQATTTLEIQIR